MKNQQEIWTILKVLNWTKGYLAEKGIENARLEAEWLLCSVLDIDRVGLYVNHDKPLSAEELSAYRAMVARRARREPLQHILGTQEFMGLDFIVSRDVLVPRHDTEVLVQEAAKRCIPSAKILDVGVGSGCVAVALAKAIPGAEIYGVDISSKAVAVAARNAASNDTEVKFFVGSLFEPVEGMVFDLIVSNPPYIPSEEIQVLQPEVRDYEPRGALDGGNDGLDFYRKIIPAAEGHLRSSGWLLFEVGMNQAPHVLDLFRDNGGYEELFAAPDAGGIERVVGGIRRTA